MKLHVKFELGGLAVDDMLEGRDALEITRKAKLVVAGKLGLLAGAVVRSMSDLEFSKEVVRRYNAATASNCPLPVTAEDFVAWAVSEDLAAEVS